MRIETAQGLSLLHSQRKPTASRAFRVLVTFAIVALVCASPGLSQNIRRVSVSSDGVEADGRSFSDSLSPVGRLSVFTSESANLVGGDTNRARDVFAHWLPARTTSIVSVGSDEQQSDQGESSVASAGAISAGGRYIVFSTQATNFDPRDTDRTGDVYARNRALGTTTLLSLSSDGIKGNGASFGAVISADARHVAFLSNANNLVEGDTNRRPDVFVHDRDADENGVFDEEGGISTKRITMGYDGQETDGSCDFAAMTPNGRFIAFESDATNLVEGDTNQVFDLFVHDRDVDENGIFDEPLGVHTYRVSIGGSGQEGDAESRLPSISADGRYVAFESWAENISCCDRNEWLDVFLRDRHAGTTALVSMGVNRQSGNGNSMSASISGDGSKVAFLSWADDMVPGDNNGKVDIFIYDVATRTVARAVMGLDGEEPDGHSATPVFAAGGCFLSFQSEATNLVEGDTNGMADVFLLQLCIPGDFDGDERVDQGDFEILESCLTGPGVRPPEECNKADLDVDLDVDLYDFTILQSYYTGT